MDNC